MSRASQTGARIDGFASTSMSALARRVPLPFGRPRRPPCVAGCLLRAQAAMPPARRHCRGVTAPEDRNPRPYKRTHHNLAQSCSTAPWTRFRCGPAWYQSRRNPTVASAGPVFSLYRVPHRPGTRAAPLNTHGAVQERDECTVGSFTRRGQRRVLAAGRATRHNECQATDCSPAARRRGTSRRQNYSPSTAPPTGAAAAYQEHERGTTFE